LYYRADYSIAWYTKNWYSFRMGSKRDPAPEDSLPLHKDVFHILVAVSDRDRHGYAILQDIAARTSGRIRLRPSSLYSAIHRMLEDGLIEELEERPDPEEDDERRRYYRITTFGRKVAIAEARRLERLLADARATGLVPKRP
jgi:DNA-binding PadR family transcriptional regulator